MSNKAIIADRRVVVTGLGVISSIGIGKGEFFNNLIGGKCGISEVSSLDLSAYDIKRGGEVKGFDPSKYMDASWISRAGRASQFAIAASKLALDDAGLNAEKVAGTHACVVVGTTMGEGGMIEEIDKHWTAMGEDDVWALTITKYPSTYLANNVNHFFGLKGTSFVIPTACASGNYSIGFGYDMVKTGMAQMAIAGGSDPFSRIGFTGFSRLYAMSPDVCRPFDKNRKGMMVGEGAGILILESLESARNRGVDIYAEILGYGLSCDANHMTAPRPEGIRKVMEKAIKISGVNPADVDLISAHGTGTPTNDKVESEAIRAVFGELAVKIPVNSIKSMLGHTMGAASAIEAISCCLAIKHGVIAPTINFTTPDTECAIDCVPNISRRAEVDVALNNSFAFGGNNACLVLAKLKD